MANFKDFYDARDEITNIIKMDLLGPVNNDEILSELPVNYYIVGKLYPQEIMDVTDDIETSAFQYTISELTKSAYDSNKQKIHSDVYSSNEEIALCNTSMPSAMGISFTLSKETEKFEIEINCAEYKKIANKENESEDKNNNGNELWKRISYHHKDVYPVKSRIISDIPDLPHNIEVNITLHKTYSDGTKTVTVSLLNKNLISQKNTPKKDLILNRSEKTIFQPEIKISAINENTFCEARKNFYIEKSEENLEADLLYRDSISYAQGHGCAVSWKSENNSIKYIKTEFLPEYKLFLMKPSSKYNNDILSMKFIADNNTHKEKIVSGINELCEQYEEWIQKQEIELPKYINSNDIYSKDLMEIAKKNIEKCRNSCKRIKQAGELINNDKTVEQAFKLANKAMFEQYKSQCRCKKIEPDNDRKWYPFQLAFFLQELVSIADPTSQDRSLVDLLWFPTGGGKTEAYLGISAFTILLRRLRLTDNVKEDGTTILMRYTLRLLTYQQFERAASLICACEVIRRQEKLPGGQISIGMWVGRALTPNKFEEAEVKLGLKHPNENKNYESIGNPVQVKICPWCGKTITKKDYSFDGKRMIIKCPNEKCDFHNESGLPTVLIDEQIYEYPPTFVVSTVDKFAQIALKDEAGALFGNCKNGKLFSPPDLIIQDELHLISGPLGTITGLYECAIKKLTSANGYSPKIIASTATIKNAADQISSLYASKYSQFPPQCINIKDSFFAEESTEEEKPSRKYMGCMAIGTSPTTMMIRVMASLLFGVHYIEAEKKYSPDVIDSFWTITDYFNSLRELGGAIVRVQDDIKYRFEYLKEKFKNNLKNDIIIKKYDCRYAELTSRIKSENISKELHKLDIKYHLPDKDDDDDDSPNPYDFLLASNMISVGVDVSRLNAMVVVGQPMLTAEYIQATSRVGRKTPGLVITTFNQAKSRDRSHFEQFMQYHNAFYKFVEATSITPFSDRARDRALQTVYVMLCRYLIKDLRDNTSAKNYAEYKDKHDDKLQEIRNYILNYYDSQTDTEINKEERKNIEEELSTIDKDWYNKSAKYAGRLLYYKPYNELNSKPEPTLFESDCDENSRFRVLNSMRSVETSVNALLAETRLKFRKRK